MELSVHCFVDPSTGHIKVVMAPIPITSLRRYHAYTESKLSLFKPPALTTPHQVISYVSDGKSWTWQLRNDTQYPTVGFCWEKGEVFEFPVGMVHNKSRVNRVVLNKKES